MNSSCWVGQYIGNVSRALGGSIEVVCTEVGTLPRLGEYVIAEHEGNAVVGRVSESSLERSTHLTIIVVQLLSSLDFKSSKIHPGVVHTASVGDRVFLGTSELVKSVAELSTPESDPVRLNFAKLFGYDVPLAFPPEKLFGRHCAIVGTTGGGKSWSVAKLVEECSKFQGKVILFDPSGEYAPLRSGVTHVHIGVGDAPEYSTAVSLPYYELTENDLFTIFQPSGEAQAPKLRAAIRSLKLAKLEPHLAPGGIVLKAHRTKLEFEQGYAKHLKAIESHGANFEIRKLARQIQNECVNPQSSPVEPNIWGGPNGVDLSLCATLVSRIEDVVSNPTLFPIFKPSKEEPSLLAVMDEFIKEPRKRVLCVSMEHLSFAYGVRETVMNALGRRLLDRARLGAMKDKPTLIILDEAHQFINDKTTNEANGFSLNSFSMIAKEGRKYGLCMCLATQRPRDIPEGVLSQMGTMIIHRLTSEADIKLVESAAGNTTLSTIGSLPTFGPGQAIMIGADFPVPLLVVVQAPEAKPVSRSADYQLKWRGSSRAVVTE